MADSLYLIRFQGSEYLLVGDPAVSGAITTMDNYTAAKASYAHLQEDGIVYRFGDEIGTRSQIEVLGEIQEPDIQSPFRDWMRVLLTDPSWEKPV